MAAIDFKQSLAMVQRLQQLALNPRAANVVTLALVLVLAYQFARWTWLVVPPPPSQGMPAEIFGAAKPAMPSGQVAQPAADLAQLHIFGLADALEAQPVVAQPIQETPLKLELRGVLASNDAATARAIIADEQRKEESYKLEAPLPGGAVLKEIHADHIVLSRNNRMETLRMPKDRLDSMSVGAPDARDAIEAPVMAPDLATSQGSLRELRDAVMNDPQSIMGLLRAEPVQEGDQISGYRLGPGQDPVMLRRFGLRHGDVVTAINGVILDGPTKLPELLRILPTAQELRIEYNRRGQNRSVVLNLNE